MVNRRKLLIGSAVGVGAAFIARPSVKGGPHADYFMQTQQALREAGLFKPTLVIDRQRLDHNIAKVKEHLPEGMAYRAVAKSLPSMALLDRVLKGTGSNRLMVFHQPFINETAKHFPNSDLLVGKPMPVGAAKLAYDQFKGGAFNPSRQLQWLIDSVARLKQYAELAETVASAEQPMQVNLEIDVGLHRGGFTDPAAIKTTLELIRDNPKLKFGGLMGYEPHIVKIPGFLGGAEGAMEDAFAAYNQAKSLVEEIIKPSSATYNMGGSQTFQLYDKAAPANELAMGSGLVMPTDFVMDSLADHQAAAFISTPVLKALNKTELPGLESMTSVFKWWDRNTAQTFYIYGGYWRAELESPPGLQKNGIWGHSSNQEMINGSTNVQLKQDDFVFFRPHQSESVFLEFGDIAVYDGGKIVDLWPVYKPT